MTFPDITMALLPALISLVKEMRKKLKEQAKEETGAEILAEKINEGVIAIEAARGPTKSLQDIRRKKSLISSKFLASTYRKGSDSGNSLQEKFYRSILSSGVKVSRKEADELVEVIYGDIVKALIANPAPLSKVAKMNLKGAQAQAIGIIQGIAARKKLEEIPGSYGERVFVGGAYDDLPDLREIEKYVTACGYVPIVAFDYEIPTEDSVPLMDIHDMDVLLIHNCRFSIFELTHAAGQYNEVEWAVRMFSKPTLGVCKTREQGAPSKLISTMVEDLFKKHGQPIEFYARFQDLEDIIRKFLK